MTREQFLQDPVCNLWLALSQQEVPIDWIKEAWHQPAFRNNVKYEFVRSVRKMGDLVDCDYWLGILPRIMTNDEVVELFASIRDQSLRHEDEWRQEFIEAFKQFAHVLPPMT